MKLSDQRTPKTACCLKSPSTASMEHRLQETTLTTTSGTDEVMTVPPQQQMNNNNKFDAVNHQKIQYRFPKKLAVDIEFTDIYYRTNVWSLQHIKPGE